MWWCALVLPATQEAEAGGSVEPSRLRLQWAMIAWTIEQDPVSKTKQTNSPVHFWFYARFIK